MQTPTKILTALAVILAGAASAQPTAFTYQGKLVDDCCPATGLYDLRFQLYDGATSPNIIGPLTITNAVPVTNGLFTALVTTGAGAWDAAPRWLEIRVATNGSATFVTLNPRQLITPTPQAIYAQRAGSVTNNAITAAHIASGQVVKSLNGLKDAINLVAGANVTLTPSGNNLTIASTGNGGAFSLNGSSAYYNAGNVGIGTTTPGGLLSLAGAGLSGSTHEQFALYADTTYGLLFEAPRDANNNLLDYTFGWRGGPPAMTIAGATRNVGIGTTTPDSLLTVGSSSTRGTFHVYGGNDLPAISLTETRAGGHQYTFYSGYGSPGSFDIVDWTAPGHRLTIDAAGKVGIGTASPQAKLHVAGPYLRVDGTAGEAAYMGGDGLDDVQFGSLNPGIGNISFYNPGLGWFMNASMNSMTAYGNSRVYGNAQVDGTMTTCVLTITGGCDLAEPFDVSEEDIPKGAVVVIDEENPGHLKMSYSAYDNRVAGIVSGANGVNPGIMLKQEGTLEGTQNVALTGRVYALADASKSPIKPGDLLTTSTTPGHAMKATDRERRDGAILGKAMTGLKEGKGHVLVLVNLQ